MSDSPTKRRTILSSLAALAAAVPLFRSGGLPGAQAPYASAPYSSGPHRSVDRARLASLGERDRVRRSLRASMAEGILAEVVNACAGGAVLTGWALYLHSSPVVIAMLGALPFASQFIQLPAAWVTCLFGYRRVALWAVGVSRQVLWPLAFLPFLPLEPQGREAVLLGVAGASALLGILGNNAWVAWMGELVPRRLRGRYFGTRTALCTLGGTLASLAAGIALDAGRAHAFAGPALAALAAAACLSGIGTTLLMRRQHEPPGDGGRIRFRVAQALAPFRDPLALRIITFQIAWNMAIGVSSAFFTVHMLANLGMGFALVAAYNAASALVRILTGPWWGKAIDRVGPRAVLTACSFGVVIIPPLWLLPQPGFLWPLLVELVISGALWSGHGLASFALPLALAPKKDRPFYLAAFASAGGFAFAIAAAIGGGIVAALPRSAVAFGHTWYAMHAVFIVSMAGRVAGAFLSMRIIEPSGRSVGELLEMARATVREVPAHLHLPAPREDRLPGGGARPAA